MSIDLPSPTLTESELRAADVPWPRTAEDLSAYIEALVSRDHDYGSSVYAMSMAAVAAFHYAAHQVGASGFQASCADMDVLRRTRGYKGPFMVIDGNGALYPQSDPSEKLQKFLADINPWLVERARANIAEQNPHVHPDVLAHWQALASQAVPA